MRLACFETATPVNERPQTYALDRAIIGNQRWTLWTKIHLNFCVNKEGVNFHGT